MNIHGYTGGRDQEVAELILSVQNVEAGLGLSVEDQPDLRDIADAHRIGGFWIAVDDREAIVGTIGLLAYGRVGVLKKFLVAEFHRGRDGPAFGLLDRLLHRARDLGMSDIVLDICLLAGLPPALAAEAPGKDTDPDAAISHRGRVYAAEQFSNTVSVTDPVDNRLLGVIRLGDSQPGNFSPLYRGELLVHGIGFSPDHRTLAVVSIGSNSVTFIDTAANGVKHTTYVGRSPHEAFFTPDGSEVWVTIRGEVYVAVLDAATFEEKTRIKVAGGPGMQIFSPDGQYGYVCSSFNPDTTVLSILDHRIVGHAKQDSPFCPNIAATPDSKQVWLTLKDTGRVMVSMLTRRSRCSNRSIRDRSPIM